MTLLEEGKTFEEINELLGTKHSQHYYREAMAEISREELLKRFPRIALAQAEQDPDLMPRETVDHARALGIPKAIMKEVQKRVAARAGQFRSTSRRLSEKETIARLEERMALAIEYLDDFAMAGATAKDLAGTIDTLNHNIQLLKGRPTQIMSIEDRRKLNELIPALLIEAQRRGVPLPAPIEAQATKVE